METTKEQIIKMLRESGKLSTSYISYKLGKNYYETLNHLQELYDLGKIKRETKLNSAWIFWSIK